MRYEPETKTKRTRRITTLRLILMRAVERHPGVSAQDLIDTTGIVSDTLRPKMRLLVKEGYVSRRREPCFMLTRKGQKMLDDIRELLS